MFVGVWVLVGVGVGVCVWVLVGVDVCVIVGVGVVPEHDAKLSAVPPVHVNVFPE